ncbi:MAG: hypothetical protein N4A76_09190 [Firmicutes bacterium]|jgi:hypothetical protein|nr:hypothetical protein [Bacillota bacterium]
MTNKIKIERAINNIKMDTEEKKVVNEILLYKRMIDLQIDEEISKSLKELLRVKLNELIVKLCD